MRRKLFIYCSVLLSLATACSDDDTNQAETNAVQNKVISFTYNGNEYNYGIDSTTNEIASIDDKTEALLDAMQSNPYLAAFVSKDGVVEYFDTYGAMLAAEKAAGGELTPDSAAICSATLAFFDEEQTNGRQKTFSIDNTGGHDMIKIANLDSIGWANRVSSLKLTTSMPDPAADVFTVTFFDESNGKGYSLTLSAFYAKQITTIQDLKSIPRYPGSDVTWNEAIRSFVFNRH